MYVFSELLRGFRNREGFSQQWLADKIGVRRNTISNWENGNYLPRDIKYVYKIIEVLNLFPKDTESLLIAADPDRRQPKKDVDCNDDFRIEINIDSGQIKILREDISSTIQLVHSLQDSITSEGLGKAQIKEIAQVFTLQESRKINGHLRYNDGDISFWYEQDLSLDELIFQFAARKVVLDAADRSGVNIDDQGTLSLVATRVISLLHRSIDGSTSRNVG
jgi:DNA-binding XRE family transcriptional regulator